jgi:hypothetical protein
MSECRRFEKAARRDDRQVWRELEAHAQECSDCREQLLLWNEISPAAPALKKSWETPALWPRIESAIAAESARAAKAPVSPPAGPRLAWLPLAAAAALFIIAMIGLQVFKPSFGEHEPLTARHYADPLLTEQALSDVEKSEQLYVASIERLSKLAEPKLKEPAAAALAVGYREKLLLLDGAIADLRAQLDRNRFNTHLRRELAAMYQEKQRTLEQVVKEVKS